MNFIHQLTLTLNPSDFRVFTLTFKNPTLSNIGFFDHLEIPELLDANELKAELLRELSMMKIDERVHSQADQQQNCSLNFDNNCNDYFPQTSLLAQKDAQSFANTQTDFTLLEITHSLIENEKGLVITGVVPYEMSQLMHGLNNALCCEIRRKFEDPYILMTQEQKTQFMESLFQEIVDSFNYQELNIEQLSDPIIRGQTLRQNGESNQSGNQLEIMLRGYYFELFKNTGQWLSCEENSYLIEYSVQDTNINTIGNQQLNHTNCIQLYINIKESQIVRTPNGYQELSFKLELNSKYCKLIHPDLLNMDINNDKYLVLPNFNPCIIEGQDTFDEIPSIHPDTSKVKIMNLVTQEIELRDVTEIVINRPYEIPQQGVSVALLSYNMIRDVIAKGGLDTKIQLLRYELSSQNEQVTKSIAQFSKKFDLDNLASQGKVHQQENHYRNMNQSNYQDLGINKKEISTSEDSDDSYYETTNKLLKVIKSQDAQKINLLNDILKLIQDNQDQSIFMQKNLLDNKTMMGRLRTDRELRTLQLKLNQFITNIQRDARSTQSLNNLLFSNSKSQQKCPNSIQNSVKKTIMKPINYDLSETIKKDKDKIEADYFKSDPPMQIIRKREQHIKRTLEWANKEHHISMSQSQIMEDQNMEDLSCISQERFDENKKKRVSLINSQMSQSFIQRGEFHRKSEDFSFMRKKVRVNVIESDIVEYELDEDEKRMKQQNSKKYL